MFKPNYSDLKPVRDAITESIHKALVAIWDDIGFRIEPLARLERIEMRAYSESYEWFCEHEPVSPQQAIWNDFLLDTLRD